VLIIYVRLLKDIQGYSRIYLMIFHDIYGMCMIFIDFNDI
jgi:hypothetical protein